MDKTRHIDVFLTRVGASTLSQGKSQTIHITALTFGNYSVRLLGSTPTVTNHQLLKAAVITSSKVECTQYHNHYHRCTEEMRTADLMWMEEAAPICCIAYFIEQRISKKLRENRAL